MASINQMTGMRGVYLVAAELSRLGFIVSPTSRSAAGADLLVTDQCCNKAWSVQVKTNKSPTNCWLLSPNATKIKSNSHLYVFVNLNEKSPRHEFHVVPNEVVASNTMIETSSTGSVWYSFMRPADTDEGWHHFGDPYATGDSEERTEETLV